MGQATATADVSALFTPTTVGGLRLDNRIVMSPMTRGFAPGGVLDARAAAYYARRAANGVGLIITEGAAPNAIGARTANVPSLFGDDALAAWRPVVRAVHDAGGRIFCQVWHAGLGRVRPQSHDPAQPSVGASALYVETDEGRDGQAGYEGGLALTLAEAEATIDDFAAAAANAKAVGFDGIELHAAHGYLIDQFFWRPANRRDDRFNGDMADRTRFAVEIIGAIRARTGAGFPVALRFSQWKLPTLWDARTVETPGELEAFLRPLAEAGAAMFDCSTRRYWEPAFAGSELGLAGWTRKLSGLPTMTVGSVGLAGPLMGSAGIGVHAETSSLAPLLERFARGEFDLVGVGRALLSNPEWASMVREGRLDALVPYSAEALHDLV